MTKPFPSNLGRAANVLLVEDNLLDAKMTLRAAEQSDLAHRFEVVSDGESALAYLRREAPYEDAPRPDLVLLDINLPGKDGHEVLAEMKSDDDLAPIPVIILTTSDDSRDVTEAYRQHAAALITKPVGTEGFLDVIRALDDFWFTIVTLPSD